MDDPILAALIEKFTKAQACWFSSTRPDGRAHLAPIWHVWHEGNVYMVTQSTSVRARNIRHQPAVSLSLPDPMDVVIVEGTARSAPERAAMLTPLFIAKYNWDYGSGTAYQMIIEVIPRKIMAWHGEAEMHRWHFDENGLLQPEGKLAGDSK